MVNQKFSTLHAVNDLPESLGIRRKRHVTCSFVSHKIIRILSPWSKVNKIHAAIFGPKGIKKKLDLNGKSEIQYPACCK